MGQGQHGASVGVRLPSSARDTGGGGYGISSLARRRRVPRHREVGPVVGDADVLHRGRQTQGPGGPANPVALQGSPLIRFELVPAPPERPDPGRHMGHAAADGPARRRPSPQVMVGN